MPQLAMRQCSGCGCLTRERRCSTCAKRHDQRRGNSHSRGYASLWAKRRLRALAREPYCRHCLIEAGREPLYWPTARQSVEAELLGVERATDVDHIIPKAVGAIAGREADEELQSLCARHHGAKTMRELRDGTVG